MFYEWPRGTEGVHQLRDYLSAYPGARYVVIDSLTRCRSVPDPMAPAFMADYNAVGGLQQLRARAGWLRLSKGCRTKLGGVARGLPHAYFLGSSVAEMSSPSRMKFRSSGAVTRLMLSVPAPCNPFSFPVLPTTSQTPLFRSSGWPSAPGTNT